MSLKDWNHFIRPNLWAFGLAIYLIGWLASQVFKPLSFILGGVVAVLLCTSSITVNHYFDAETDKKSKQIYRFPVAAGRISKRTAFIFSLIVILISVVFSYFLGSGAFYLTLFANFMVVSYSMKPIRIKERAFLETFWNAVGYGWIPYYLALLISGVQINLNMHLLGLIPFFISASGHILLQVRDIQDDKKGGVRTTSTILGLKKMKKVSGALIVLAGFAILYLAFVGFLNYLAWVAVLFGVLIGIEHKKMKKNVEKSYRKLQILYIVGGLLFILSVLRI